MVSDLLFPQLPADVNNSMVDSGAPEDDGAVQREGPGAPIPEPNGTLHWPALDLR